MTVQNQKFDIQIDVAEPVKSAPQIAGPESGASRDQRILRTTMIKLAFAGLLTVCAVFEIYSIVNSVAQSTRRITAATQSQKVLTRLDTHVGGLGVLAGLQPLELAQAEITAQSQLIANELQELRLLAGAGDPVSGAATLDSVSATAVTNAYAIAGGDTTMAPNTLQRAQTAMSAQIDQTRLANEATARHWLGGVMGEARLNLFVMIIFMGASLFMVSTIMITGYKEMKRRDVVEAKLRRQVAEAQPEPEDKPAPRPLFDNADQLTKALLAKTRAEEVKKIPSVAHKPLPTNGIKPGETVSPLDAMLSPNNALRDDPFAPRELIREAIDLVGVYSQAKGLMLSSEVAGNLPKTLRGDSLRISQVILNLLNNGIKYTPEGFVTLRVSANDLQDDIVSLRVEIQDSGIGISDSDQAQLFAGSTAVGALTDGTGLAAAQDVVRKMGGEIEVFSRQGEGASFWFYLDLPVEEHLPKEPEAPVDTTVLRDKPMTVLLIDDSEETLELVEMILGREGVTVDTLANPELGLKMIIDMEPDVILCDMQMPQMSGMELTRQIRTLPKPYGDIPLVAFSATTNQEEIEEMLMAGADAFVAKPFQSVDLVEAVCGVHAGASFGMQPPTVPSDTFHELDELVELMGPDWTLSFVARLSERLERVLEGEGARKEQMSDAHMVVAEAGQLGQRDLAWSATAFEQGMRKKALTQAVRDRFETHARTFLTRLPRFKQRIRTGE